MNRLVKWCVVALGLLGMSCTPVKRVPVDGRSVAERIFERRNAGDTVFLDLNPIMRTSSWFWNNARSHEWIGCVQGRMDGDTITTEAIEMADIMESDSSSVSGVCRETDALIARIHPHTNGACMQSDTDAWTFVMATKLPYDFILCGENAIWVAASKVPFTRLVY